MDNQNKKLGILICVMFFLGFYLYIGQLKIENKSPNYGHEEFLFHYRKAKGEDFCKEFYDVKLIEIGENGEVISNPACERYPPFFHWLAKPFSFSQQHFLLFSLVIVCFLIPIILLHFKKHWVSVLFYWAVSFPYIMESGFHYPQLLATATLLIFLLKKNWKIRIVLLILSIGIHTSAPILLTIAWTLELAFNKKTWTNVFPSCTTGVVIKEPLTKESVLTERAVGWINKGYILNWAIKSTPLPFIAFALKQFWVQKQYGLIALSVVMFFAVVQKGRILESLQIVLLLGVIDYYKVADKKMKYGLIILALLSIALQILSWQHYRLGTFTTDC